MVMTGLFLKAGQRDLSSSTLPFSPSWYHAYGWERTASLRISSNAFPEGGLLPSTYTYSAANINPSLCIKGLPRTTRSLLVVLEHRNAPIAPRTHWLCWDLPPLQEIRSGEQRGKLGRNDFLINGYTGPLGQPFSGSFCFIVFALRRALHLPMGASRYQAQRSLAAELLAVGELPFFA